MDKRLLPALLLATLAATGCRTYVVDGDRDFRQRPGGIYDGTVALEGEYGETHLVGVVTDYGEARFVDAAGRAYVASVPSEHGFEGSMALHDGVDRATGPFDGHLEERHLLDGDFTVYSSRTGYRDGRVTTDNDDLLFETPADVRDLTGVWATDSGSVALTFEPDGGVWGQDADGCTYSGEAFADDLDTSVYQLELDVSCGGFTRFWHGLVAPTLAFTDYALFLSISAGDDVFAAVLFE